MSIKNTILLFVFGVAVSFFAISMAPLSHAQEMEDPPVVDDTFNLEDALEPQQVELLDETADDQSALEASNELDEEADAFFAEEPDEDALPKVNTTILNVKTEGFDYGNQSASVEIQDFEEGMDRKKSPEELAEEIRREAYDAALTGLFPLRPEDIRRLLQEYDETRRAVEEPVQGIPTPKVNVTTVSLDPGVPPLELKTATGHITSLNILDVTGAPWPVQDISWAGDFEIIEPEEGGHIIRITPMAHSAYGNMSIRLLTLKTPITIMLKTSRDEVQYRVDARIPEYGPFAKAPLIDSGNKLVAGNALLMSILDGTPPEVAERLQVSGVDGRTSAYKINNKTYVRTPLTLLSPGWDQSVSSADGMKVYSLNDTPVVLLSDRGKFMRASLTPGKDLFDE